MTEKYLNKSAKELFWIFWLGIPYLIWMYSIGIELNKKNLKHKRLNKILLITLVIYPIAYIISILIMLFSGNADLKVIKPFHFGAMFCIFSLMILTTITIIKFETSEKLKKSNGIELFLGIWVFVIGSWYVQPKLNKYIKQIK